MKIQTGEPRETGHYVCWLPGVGIPTGTVTFKEAGVVVRVIVGGAPFLFDDKLWREVGADAMGRNAAEAVALVGGWMQEMDA